MDPKNSNRESRSTPQYALYQRENFWKNYGGEYYASSSFYRHRIISRMLVDTNAHDTTTTLFGRRVPAPIGFAPVSINKIYHPLGELPVAKVVGELGLPYCLSTAGSQSIEDVGRANDGAAKGEEGWRHDDVATSNYAFYHGTGADLGLSDPVFQQRLQDHGINPTTQPNEAGALWTDNVWHSRAHTWEKVQWVMDLWKEISGGKPFCLKGIQSVDDARKAVEVVVDGIVVSNHAGRQVDGAIASLGALKSIVDAVGDKTSIMFDSGVRSASDVFKALALGAKFVFVEVGVRHVMKSLLAEFDILLNAAGYKNVSGIDRTALESGPKDYPLLPVTAKL
ncbi:FMN-linked oxidoreductase [Lentithecium fluviatile CBS 122367]|uniref:FMN-linked oxidoreductase n=1 Tax=Lentithecium fluviatile CBS 122367 TaxID=1168545 RepID=A0A6G1IH35_9PLEO|nr:FMN-linked oxidoreductase [Lentithecium fluviatile CBS 122367]